MGLYDSNTFRASDNSDKYENDYNKNHAGSSCMWYHKTCFDDLMWRLQVYTSHIIWYIISSITRDNSNEWFHMIKQNENKTVRVGWYS